MNFANIGIGLNALTSGIVRGLSLGKELKNIRNERELEVARREGLEAAQKQREEDISKLIQTVSLPDSPEPIFQVGSQTFKTQDEARKAAEASVDDVMGYFYNYQAPKIVKNMIAQGDIERATEWDKLIRSQQGQRAIRDWQRFFLAYNSGNLDKAVEGFANYYSRYVDPSISLQNYEVVQGETGPIIRARMKDKDSGREFDLQLDRRSFLETMFAYNPADLARRMIEQEDIATAARAEDAKKEREFARSQIGKEREILLQSQAEERLKRLDWQLRAQFRERFGDNGDELASLFRKEMSPADRAQKIQQWIMENDPSFAELPPDKRRARIRELMDDVYEVAREAARNLVTGSSGRLYIIDNETGQRIPVDKDLLRLP